MATETYTGTLADAGLAPLVGKHPRLLFRLDQPATSERYLIVREPVAAAIDDQGRFAVHLQPSEAIDGAPEYIVRAEWMDGAGNFTGMDVFRFFAHAGGGDVGRMVTSSRVAPARAYWQSTRPEPFPKGEIWVDSITSDVWRSGGSVDQDVFLGNIRGGKGDKGDQGLPGVNAVPADSAVGAYAKEVTTQTYAGIAAQFLADDAATMNSKPLYTNGDSFGQIIGPATTSWPLELAADRTMVLTNGNVSSSLDRDVAMRMNGTPPLVAGTSFVVLNGGVNPANMYGTDDLTRRAEKAALQCAILLGVAGSRLEHTAATATGTWADHVSPRMSSGAARSSDVAGSTMAWTPPWGDWFALGFSFRQDAGATGSTGEWRVGGPAGTVVLAARTTAPPMTRLEQVQFADSAQNHVPWPVMMPALDGSKQVHVRAPGAAITVVDALWKIADVPPIVAVLLPGYCQPGGSLAVPNATLDVYRGDRLAAIAEITAKYPRLRGRVIPVDPHLFGWNPAIHTISDGLHPNDAGHALLALAVQRTIGRAQMLAPMMPTWGIAGPSWPTEWPAY